MTLFAIATKLGAGLAAWTADVLIALGGWRESRLRAHEPRVRGPQHSDRAAPADDARNPQQADVFGRDRAAGHFRFGTLLAVFIAPQYLARIQGFRIEQLAGAMLTMAAATLLTAPVAYWLAAKLDPRIALSAGLGAIALAAAMCVQSTPDWARDEFIVPLLLAGSGQALFSVATMRYAVFGATRRMVRLAVSRLLLIASIADTYAQLSAMYADRDVHERTRTRARAIALHGRRRRSAVRAHCGGSSADEPTHAECRRNPSTIARDCACPCTRRRMAP